MMVSPGHFLTCLPISAEELFCPLDEINIGEVEELLEVILYEAFENSVGCFENTIKMCSQLSGTPNFHIKSFSYSDIKGLALPSNLEHHYIIKNPKTQQSEPYCKAYHLEHPRLSV